MVTGDPYDRIIPPVKLSDLEEDPEPRMDLDEVFSEYQQIGREVTPEEVILYTDVCRFDEIGNHTYMAQECPHYNMFDETGRIIRPGWTVQGGS